MQSFKKFIESKLLEQAPPVGTTTPAAGSPAAATSSTLAPPETSPDASGADPTGGVAGGFDPSLGGAPMGGGGGMGLGSPGGIGAMSGGMPGASPQGLTAAMKLKVNDVWSAVRHVLDKDNKIPDKKPSHK